MNSRILHADPQLPRTGGAQQAQRQAIDVAVGILIRADGSFLLTTRPPGKAYAGYWEFPGGKLEAGETVAQALARELNEELGLTLEAAAIRPWHQQLVDYPHALVRLHFCKVHAWRGQPQMREGQQHAWQTLPVQVAPVLPGTIPVLQWLQEQAREKPPAAPSAKPAHRSSNNSGPR